MDTFICGECHNEYKTPDITEVPIMTIGNSNVPTKAYQCWNCGRKTNLKNKKRRRKDRIVNES